MPLPFENRLPPLHGTVCAGHPDTVDAGPHRIHDGGQCASRIVIPLIADDG